MKKIIFAITVAFALAGCNPSASTVAMPIMPQGFEDCKIAHVSNGMSSMYLARCPGSTTVADYPQGKTRVRTVTVDGTTYTKDEK